MVTLGPAAEGDGFDHIGIERALGQEIGTAQLLRLLLEHVDEQAADDLALLFGVGNAGKLAEEQVARVAMDQRDVVVVAEQAHHRLALALAQQPVVDEDAVELAADRFVNKHGSHG